jgi:hypothetical protein
MRFTRSDLHRLIGMMVLASVGLLAFSQARCANAPKQTMESSVENTSGEGTVEAKAGPNDNTQIEVRVKHLSPPARVASDASVYVVWIQPRHAEIQNVGALKIDTDLVGKLDTTTPHRTFTLTVTPEPSARMAAPTHGAVFTAEVNRAD